jgi:hypothetical protein
MLLTASPKIETSFQGNSLLLFVRADEHKDAKNECCQAQHGYQEKYDPMGPVHDTCWVSER